MRLSRIQERTRCCTRAPTPRYCNRWSRRSEREGAFRGGCRDEEYCWNASDGCLECLDKPHDAVGWESWLACQRVLMLPGRHWWGTHAMVCIEVRTWSESLIDKLSYAALMYLVPRRLAKIDALTAMFFHLGQSHQPATFLAQRARRRIAVYCSHPTHRIGAPGRSR